MSEKKLEITADILMADAMLRLAAIERILIEKNVCSKEDLSAITDEIAQKVAKIVLEKTQNNKVAEDLTTDPDKKVFNN